jgi:hypothetical protein
MFLWLVFCKRLGMGDALRASGEKEIEQDPEYWADQTMWDLLDVLSGKKQKG